MMPITKYVKIKKDREQNIYRRHPWIFSGALSGSTEDLQDGDVVQILDYKNDYLGAGHFHKGSIAVKVLAFKEEALDDQFWAHRFSEALHLRNEIPGLHHETNCFRLIHGEGDRLPGLVIDVYHDTIVIQCHSIGMHRQIKEIQEALINIWPGSTLRIVDKSKETLPSAYASKIENRFLLGKEGPVEALENGLHFIMDPLSGQKTGFFLDQRENRKLLGQYAKGRTILNAFSYTGGFSLYALKNGSKECCSADISQKALDGLQQNLRINGLESLNHISVCADVIDYLKGISPDHYDLIVLDPPAFAKTIDKRHQAVQAYKRINLLAMKKIKKGGLLFSFSCSQVVSEELFYHTLASAGMESNRQIRVLHKLSQGPDHPVNLFHPEGSYLKGLVLQIL